MKAGKRYKVVSLFSGCGGMDLGFEGGFKVHKDSINEAVNPGIQENPNEKGSFVQLRSTAFQTVFANDILPSARTAWLKYFSHRQHTPDSYHLESIVDLVKRHKDGQTVFPADVDIVIGGFPCQDFSIAGKRKGFLSHKDHTGKVVDAVNPTIETRGQLYMWMKEVIEITRPALFIAENVKGLVNLEDVKEIIQKDFASSSGNGYIVLRPQVLQAADYGVPQSRERVIFIGVKKSALKPEALKALSSDNIPEAYNPYPSPTHAYKARGSQLKEPVKLAKIFEHLAEPAHSKDISQQHYSRAKFMGKHCQGQTEVNLQGVGPTIRSEHHGNIEFRRLSAENGGKLADEINGRQLQQRRLTPRECALIQTFPPDYECVIRSQGARFAVSPSAAYKIIGNAVPPLLAFHLASRIEKMWEQYFGYFNP